jgi:hypothetical protein
MKLKKIMKIGDSNKRELELLRLAQEIGVSTLQSVNAQTGRHEESILVERIQQGLLIHHANKMWIVALCSAIASAVSAIVSLVVVFNNLSAAG